MSGIADQKQTDKGCIYVLWNDMFQWHGECYKIGSTNNLKTRINNFITAYPTPPQILFQTEDAPNILLIERTIHTLLAPYRMNKRREFFTCSLDLIIATIEQVQKMSLEQMRDIVNTKPEPGSTYSVYEGEEEDDNQEGMSTCSTSTTSTASTTSTTSTSVGTSVSTSVKQERKQCIAQTIKSNRPSLSQNTISTYCSLIDRLCRILSCDIRSHDDIAQHAGTILTHLNNSPNLKPKTKTLIITAIITFIGDSNTPLVETFRSHLSNVEPCTLSWNDVLDTHNKLEQEIAPLWEQQHLNKKQFMRLQDYVLLSMLVYTTPRRELDLIELLHRETSTTINYVDHANATVHWKIHTTLKTGALEQTSKLPSKLVNILEAWLQKNASNYMFVMHDGKTRLVHQQIGYRLRKIFHRPMSVNTLRHLFLSTVHTSSEEQTLGLDFEDDEDFSI